jgi:hypothetical protein
MDFIERLFGFAPDGGNGMVEFALIVVPLIAGGVLWLRRQRVRNRREASTRADA